MLILNLEGLVMVPKYVVTNSEINNNLHRKMETALETHGEVANFLKDRSILAKFG